MPRSAAPYHVPLLAFGAGALLIAAGGARAQPAERAAFVANNGNLEGSVASYTFNPDGSPRFVAKLVTGSRPNSQVYHPGTNAYAISLSPDGRFLTTSHTTSSSTVEQLSVLRVNPDATLSLLSTFTTPDSPLDVQWLSNDVLAATRTRTSGTNEVIVYRFDPGVPSLTEVDREATGAFNTALVLHPSGDFLYAQDSTGNQIRAFAIAPDGTLTGIGSAASGGIFPLGPGITHDGRRIYAGGGISSGGNKVVGFDVDPSTGVPALMPASPFLSNGSSPKLAIPSTDDRFVFVGHGTDATLRVFAIDPLTGGLTNTGVVFDVGFQGSLGDAATLGGLVLVTDDDTIFDGISGLYSFTVNADGSLTQHGPAISSQGIAPGFIAVWEPPASCAADFNGDGSVNIGDFLAFLSAYGKGDPRADFDADGAVDIADFLAFLTAYDAGCP